MKIAMTGVKFSDDLAKPDWGMQNLFDDSFGDMIMFNGESKS